VYSQQIREPVAKQPDASLDDPVVRKILRPDLVLGGGYPEKNDARDVESADLLHLPLQHFVDGEVKHAWHRADLALDGAPVHDEEWLDQVGGGETVFPDETAQRVSPAAAARSYSWSGRHEGRLGSARYHRNHVGVRWNRAHRLRVRTNCRHGDVGVFA
jgi:hypothetical protein